MNETAHNRRRAPQDKTTVHGDALEATPTTDDAADRAMTSQPGSPSASPVSAPMPSSEPANRRWLVAALVVGTIALLLVMVMIIAIKAGIVTLN